MLENCGESQREQMLKMLQNKIKIQKIDIYSFVMISVIFVLDRLSKIYVVDLIQHKGGEVFLYDFLMKKHILISQGKTTKIQLIMFMMRFMFLIIIYHILIIE